MKKFKIKERHYYFLHWETDDEDEGRFFNGVVFSFRGSLVDPKTGDEWSELDHKEILSLVDLGVKWRKLPNPKQ